MPLILDSQPTYRTIPVGYLSAEGKAAVQARAEELRQHLAQRRAERDIGIEVLRLRLRLRVPAPAPRDLSPAFADSVRGDLDVMVSA